MKKLLTLTALIGATTIAMTACGGETLAEVTANIFTQERIAEYTEEFKDADFATAKHTLSTGFELDKEVVGLRAGYINTAVGDYFYTVFQNTTFVDWGYSNLSIVDWNKHGAHELAYSKYLMCAYLPATHESKITSEIKTVANPIATQGEIYLAKVYVDIFWPNSVKTMSLFEKTGEFATYAYGQVTDGSEEPTGKYPRFNLESKEMYKLN